MRQIFVDSRDRVSGTSCDFTIQLPQTLVLEGKHRGRVDHLRVPLTVPTIQTGLNDTLRVQLGTNVYTITLPQQNFDGPGLAAQIQSLLASTAPGSWSCSYNTSSIAMTLTCSNPFSIPVGNPGTYGAYLLGRSYAKTSNSYVFQNVFVYGIDVMYLGCSDFGNLDTIGPQGSHDTLMSVNVTLPFGAVQTQDMPWDSYFDLPSLTTQQLSFSLRDRNYNVLSTLVPNISFVLLID